MLIKINGKQTEVIETLTIQGLLESKNLPVGGVVVELNGIVVRSDGWHGTSLKPGDQIEIVRYVGGG